MSTNNTSTLRFNQASVKKYKKLIIKDLFHQIAGLSKAQKRILNYFIYMAQRVRSLYMMQEHIGRVSGVTREWANKCIALLSGLGLIYSKRRRKNGDDYRSNVYALKVNFFSAEIAEGLYPILSSLRDIKKKFTQVEKEEYIKGYYSSKENNSMDVQPPDPPKKEKIDVMGMTLQEILALRRPQTPQVPQNTRQDSVRRSGFKRMGRF